MKQLSKSSNAARFRALRSNLGMSQRDFAREFRVSASAVAHWETGARSVSGPVLKLLEIYESRLKESPQRRII